jgi:ADP-ribose pyrophosphatase YjhB (NUDIX family)
MRRMLADYLFTYPETANAHVLQALIDSDDDLYARGRSLVHVTASGWILSQGRACALLIEHGVYKIFVPPGGHVDLGETALQAALREVGEEVGLVNLIILNPTLFDLDIHRIAASKRKGEPEHWHIDVRFALWNDKGQDIRLNQDECLSAKWVPINDLLFSQDSSLKRMAEKSIKFF